MTEIPLAFAKKAFYVDGSLRDIYLLGTNEQDWQKLLTFLHTSSYSVRFIIAGEQQPIPEGIGDVFSLVDTHGGMLQIDTDHLKLHCYFYTYEEIEFDIDPRNISNERQIFRLLNFMRMVGIALSKEIVLTPESMPKRPLFRFNSTTGDEEWYLDMLSDE
jgi:hypothetical protein